MTKQGGRCVTHGAWRRVCNYPGGDRATRCGKNAIVEGMCKKHHDRMANTRGMLDAVGLCVQCGGEEEEEGKEEGGEYDDESSSSSSSSAAASEIADFRALAEMANLPPPSFKRIRTSLIGAALENSTLDT